MIKKLRSIVIICAIIVSVFIGGAVALLTDGDSVNNQFVVGRIATELHEESWSPPDEIVPRESISKNPTITNVGENDQYVFMEVQIPHEVRETANTDGTKNDAKDVQLFWLDNLSSNWILVSADTEDLDDTGYWTYVYAYASPEEMTKLKAGEVTDELFSSVTFANVIEDDEKIGEKYYININAYAIQTENLDDQKNVTDGDTNDGTRYPSDVWEIVKNQGNVIDNGESYYTFNVNNLSSTGVKLKSTYSNVETNGMNVTITPAEIEGYTTPAAQTVALEEAESSGVTFTYTPIEYSITFDLDGGIGVSDTTYTIETATFALNKPTKAGYVFDGYTGSNGQKPQKNISILKGNIGDRAYKANWVADTYTVKYDANGGAGFMADSEITYGTNGTLSANSFTREGYAFTGWNTAADGSGTSFADTASVLNLVTPDVDTITLYAQWKVGSYAYDIVYKSSTGTQLGTDTVTKQFGTTNSVSPKAFTGYTSPATQSVVWDSTSAKTITFTYTPIEYDVTVDLDGGTGVNNKTYTIETATFALETPTKTGYAFTGWTGSNGTTAQKSVSIAKGSTGDKSYTANWDANSYTYNIVYKTDAGTQLGTGSVTKDFGTTNTVSPKAFTGYTSPTAQSVVWDSTSAKTITFTYTPITYTVNCDANGGTGTMSGSTHTYDASKALTANVFTKTGYTFSGWNTAVDGSGTFYADNANVSNLTSIKL